MKLNQNHLIFLALIFLGTTILYHTISTKSITGEAIADNFKINDFSSEETIIILNSKINKLEERINLLENETNNISNYIADTKEYLIIGGGFVNFKKNESECSSWGLANCSNEGNTFVIVCPENYNLFNFGEYRVNPLSTYDVINWFLCVNNMEMKKIDNENNENYFVHKSELNLDDNEDNDEFMIINN
ncbi:hypothetical protein K9L16_02995 [Candidatus Pacearchaeota archaeon]|nr:hypothetical protein [Candidatus Pacearchaeota archaeon]